MRRPPLERLAALASVIFIIDFATKRWALGHLADPSLVGGVGLHLAVVNNTRLAGGLDGGGFELEITALALVAIVLLVGKIQRHLTAVDASAPTMLGLLLGAGAANLADALIPPHGVVDFIALTLSTGATITINLADVAAAVGIALCARTAWRILQTMRGRRELPLLPSASRSDAPAGRLRWVVAGGHGLFAMCAFVWIYSMVIVWTPDAGSSAPNALLLGVGVFAAAFVGSQARLAAAARRAADAPLRPRVTLTAERLVMDGSLAASAAAASGDAGNGRERGTADMPRRREHRLPDFPGPAGSGDGERRA